MTLNPTRGFIIASSQLALALAAAKIGLHVFPCRAKAEGKFEAKTPYTWNGHLAGTTDEEAIRAMWRDHPTALVGVHAGPSGVVCLDIDMDPEAETIKDGWFSIGSAEIEVPESWHYSTRRGGDHYIYLAPEGVRLNGTKNHVTPNGTKLQDVDRRGGSSFFIIWSDEIPADRSAFKPAPEWLCTPAHDPEKTPYRGTADEWLDRCPKGEPSTLVRAWVEAIPRDFGHVEMIEAQRALVGLAVDDGEPGIPWAIDSLRSAWLAGQWDTAKGRRDWATGLSGAIAKFGAFRPGPRDIGHDDGYIEHVNGIRSEGFTDVYTSVPPSGAKDAMRERVSYIASIGLSEGLSLLDAANLAWNSAAARESIRKNSDEEEAKSLLWQVVVEAAMRPTEAEAEFLPDEPEPDAEGTPKKRVLSLLSSAERRYAENIRSRVWGGDYRWWGDQFMEKMREIHPVMSDPYYRTNRWVLLSLCFADIADIELESGGRIIFNFYIVLNGPSNSGKSESLEPVREVSNLLWDSSTAYTDHTPWLGGDATSAGLTLALIHRNNKPTIFNSDEADAVLNNWSNERSAFAGMKQRVTEIYNGRVPAIQRSGMQDVSGQDTHAFFNAHLIGVDTRIAEAIRPEDWETGFINRFVWAEGERKFRTDEMRRLRVKDKSQYVGSQKMGWAQSWASKFRTLRAQIAGEPPETVHLTVDDQVLDRHVELGKKLEAVALHAGPYAARLDTTFRRLEVYALKCAALVALTEARTHVELADYVLALEQVEEWGENVMEMVRRTDIAQEARMMRRLWEFVKQNGGKMTRSSIYRSDLYAGRSEVVDKLARELEKARMAEWIHAPGSPEPVLRVLEVAG